MSSGLPLKADLAQGSRHVSNVPIAEVLGLPIRSPHRRASAGSVECRVGVVQPGVWVRAQAALSKSTIKSRVIGTASRLVDSST
jgi:hypothetical protein